MDVYKTKRLPYVTVSFTKFIQSSIVFGNNIIQTS